MVAEPWILKMGNQVSSNLKHALLFEPAKKTLTKSQHQHQEKIGILSFEVANVMSKTVYLYKSLHIQEISKLKNEILKSEGVKALVSTDEARLLELAVAEKLDDLNRVAGVVARLGRKCTVPALLGFEHVYGDVVSGAIDVKELGFLVKDMEGMVRRMERYVNSTGKLYGELEVLSELEQATKKFQRNQHEESWRAYEQKLIWQKQDVRHLKDVSLWNQTFDKVVELLARTVCTIYARICMVFGEAYSRGGSDSCLSPLNEQCGHKSGQIGIKRVVSNPLRPVLSKNNAHDSRGMEKMEVNSAPMFRPNDFNFPCGASPGKLFLECLSLSSSGSKIDEEEDHISYDDRSSRTSGVFSVVADSVKRDHPQNSNVLNRAAVGFPFGEDQRRAKCNVTGSLRFGPKSRLIVHAPPSTVGGSALALHYANVIIVIEKLIRYAHLVGDEARDDLYQMLPTSLRMSLKTSLKSYLKDLAIYDASLAHDWKERLDGILRWLAPMAHNMIRWQSERNFEQQQIVTRTNVLLLQTLYFADRAKTEAAICELLVGLNYICRYEHQQNALLDCASSFDFDDCVDWQLHY